MQFKYFSYPPILSSLEVSRVELPRNSGSAFEKVGERPHRYKPSSAYYARIKRNGKEIRQTLKTRDRVLAKHRLTDKQREGLDYGSTFETCALTRLELVGNGPTAIG